MSFLTKLWSKILGKLGVLGAALTLVAAQLRFAISTGNVALARFRFQQIRELGQALIMFADQGDEALEDDTLTAVETSGLLLGLETVVVEAADIFKRQPPETPKE